MKRVLVFLLALGAAEAQTNKTANYSFEIADPGNGNLAANWVVQYGGYTRVQPPRIWDGSYALQLLNTSSAPSMRGALQEIVFNQTTAKPILITVKVRGQNIVDSSTDKYGAV